MSLAAQLLADVTRAIMTDQPRLPDHREAMASVGGPVTFHYLLTREIETLTAHTGQRLTWRRVAPELVEDDAETWAMIAVTNVRNMIDDVSLIIGSLWVIDAEQSARVELKPAAATARVRALRAPTVHDAALVLEVARKNLSIVAQEHSDPAVGMTVKELLEDPLKFEDIVAAAKLLGERVGIYFRS